MVFFDYTSAGVNTEAVLNSKLSYLLKEDIGIHKHTRPDEKPWSLCEKTRGHQAQTIFLPLIFNSMPGIWAHTRPRRNIIFIF